MPTDCPLCFAQVNLSDVGTCPRCKESVRSIPESPFCQVLIRRRSRLPNVCYVCGGTTTRVVELHVRQQVREGSSPTYSVYESPGRVLALIDFLQGITVSVLRSKLGIPAKDKSGPTTSFRLPECEGCAPLGRRVVRVNYDKQEARFVVHKCFREALTSGSRETGQL
jgi:hypothetical protein